jgi:hypothetical protein
MATKLKNKPGRRKGTSVAFMDDYTDVQIEFRFRNNNWTSGRELLIELEKFVEEEQQEEQRCDMGHFHPVVRKVKKRWATISLDEADIKHLRAVLNKRRAKR